MASEQETARLHQLLELIAEFVGLADTESVLGSLAHGLPALLAFDQSTLVLRDPEGTLAAWSMDRPQHGFRQVAFDALPSGHASAVDALLTAGATGNDARGAHVAAFALRTPTDAGGALCLSRGNEAFAPNELQLVQHLCNALGGVLARLRRQEDAVRQQDSEARYRLLVESVTDYAIYMLDAQGFIASWNSGAQRLKGYTEPEVLGRHFSIFYPEEDVRAGLPARTLDTAARAGRFEAEAWRQAKGGRRFWAHVVVDPIRSPSGELIGFAKVTRDLSERRVAEESLRRSEEQFRLLVQGVTDYAIYMLDPHGTVTNWNSGAQRIKGYAAHEVVGSHFSRFYPPEERERGEPQRALATASREGRFESEGWRVRRDGSRFWANVVVDPIRDATGAIIGFAKVTRDVTEKRQVAQALELARESLLQSQKLEAIGQLTGGVAHDFNNLLMVVLSGLELARRRLPDDDKLRSLLDNATKGARRGVSLTQRMLAFARRQQLDPVAVDIATLLQSMDDMLTRSLAPVHAAFDVPAGLSPVLIDPNQLELAILNLAVNARDAMPDGGVVAITAREETVAATGPDTGEMAPGRYICLSLADKGAGMDKTTLERAMEPFFTTKGPGKGTGLGLPMVHGLAAQSGGRLLLKSSVGVGTTAELWLPVSATAVLQAVEAPPGAHALHEPPRLVVAVDDDGLVLAGTVAMLEDLGHTVLPATSAPEAIDLVRANPKVALVVADQIMPGMTGSELIEVLAREKPGLPVVLASGYAELATAPAGQPIQLAKPFDQDELAQAIHAAMAAAEAEHGAHGEDGAPSPSAPPALRILVIEDNPEAAALLAELLQLDGHQVETALTGSAGLARVRDGGLDLVLLDIGLPDMTGYEVAKRLDATAPRDYRLVALTGYGGEQVRLAIRAAGFDDHRVKPLSAEELNAVVRACVRR